MAPRGGIHQSGALLILLGLVMSSGQLVSGEQLSRSIGWAILFIYGVPYLTCVAPALFLAAINRYLPFALVLCIMVAPVTFIAFRYA